MKKKIYIASALLLGAFIIQDAWSPVISRGNGAPTGGYTGSPSDGKTCTSCHTGTAASNQDGWITSNIPVDGYTPGNTYTITGTAIYIGRSKFGFEISPQNTSGNLIGAMIATNSTETQLIESGKYITHTSAGTNGIDTVSWTFDWIAPSTGTGDFSFYGAFNCANNNGNSSGDIIYTSSLSVNEKIIASIYDHLSSQNEFKIITYPNPIKEGFNLSFESLRNENVMIHLFDFNGKNILSEVYLANNGKNTIHIITNQLNSGVYFLELSNKKMKSIKKIIVE